MLKILLIITVILVVAVFAMPAPEQKSSWNKTVKHLEVEKLFQGSEEKTAKDALWTAKNMFKVGVLDDGTRRDGYAMYVCEVLSDYGLRVGTRVQIIDVVKLNRDGDWVALGKAKCS